ncbi:MAG: S-layer homology domain-containing protein, partial [Chloroflexi bacterium]|nr:S-layer homology domain-containing protein [Chloroflexota bacterium]
MTHLTTDEQDSRKQRQGHLQWHQVIITLMALLVSLGLGVGAASAALPLKGRDSLPAQGIRQQNAKVPAEVTPTGTDTPVATDTTTPTTTSTTTPIPPCGLAWRVVPASTQFPGNILEASSVVSANDIWAVGVYYDDQGTPHTLTEHWDGTQWSVVPSPSPGSADNYLGGVAVVSANDVWAVGYYDTGNGTPPTLVEHWDGTQWSVVPSPSPGSQFSVLQSIAVVSANDIWAVGYDFTGAGVGQTLAEHWDGTQWSIVASPNPGSSDSEFAGVSVVSANDVWAVGYQATGGNQQTLTEHWDGTQWSVVPSPGPGSASHLQSTTVVSANDVWAVGAYRAAVPQTLTEHWDGAQWSVVPSPNAGDVGSFLNSVAKVSANDVWAVGLVDQGSTELTLTEHWDGSAWTIVPSSDPSAQSNYLTSVAVVSATDVWAVGSYRIPAGTQPLVEQYSTSDTCLTPSATATVTRTDTPTATPTAVTTATPTPACGLAWRIASIPDTGRTLMGEVAVVSASDVWVVGAAYDANNQNQTLTEHWDGAQWTVVPSPNVPSRQNVLFAVAVVSANDVWAVGITYSSDTQTLTEHWDGTQWSIVPSPNATGSTATYLRSVTTISANDVWAAGYYIINNQSYTLTEHWDGTQWSVVPSPNRTGDNYLQGVSAVSANDVWAVGNSYDGVNEPVTLIEHWDGSAWSIVSSPNVGPSTNYLNDVAVVAANDVWAVGTWFDDSQPAEQTLTLHWDGTQWSVVPSPNGDPSTPNFLFRVAAVSANDAWAVGRYGNFNDEHTLTEHWDGTQWSIVSSPAPGTQDNSLGSVAIVSAGDVWAIGNIQTNDVVLPLIEHYNDPCATPSPTVQATNTRTATETATAIATSTVQVTSTAQATMTSTSEATSTTGPSSTPGGATETATTQATITPTACTISFSDVPTDNTFYANIECLACKGIISGYDDGTFRPNNQVTRGQIAKIVSNS